MTFTVRGLIVPITGTGGGTGRSDAGRAVREDAAAVVLRDTDGGGHGSGRIRTWASEGARGPVLTPLPGPVT